MRRPQNCWRIGALAVALAGTCAALPVQSIAQTIETQGGTTVTVPAQASVQIIAPSAPPALREEPVPPPPSTTVSWEPGYWSWSGGNWVWVGGHYVQRPSTQAVWEAGHWVQQPNGWLWMEGHWRVAER